MPGGETSAPRGAERDRPRFGQRVEDKVTAPPVDGAANRALVHFLAETLGCPRSSVQIIHGQSSRHKTVAIAGMSAAEALARLKV